MKHYNLIKKTACALSLIMIMVSCANKSSEDKNTSTPTNATVKTYNWKMNSEF